MKKATISFLMAAAVWFPAAGSCEEPEEPDDVAAGPTFVVKTSPIVLAAGSDSERILIEGTNLEDAADQPLEVLNLGEGPSEIVITFTAAEKQEFFTSDGKHYWRVTLDAEGLPVETDLNLTAGIKWGENRGVADFTVSTKTQGTLTWTVTQPKKQVRLQQAREITFPVETGARPIELRLAGSSFQDAATLAWLPNADLGLRLGSEEPVEDVTRRVSVKLPPNATTPVVLELGGNPPAGNYAGAVTLAAKGNPATQSFDLEIHSSSFGHRLGGTLLIGLGVALSFFVTVVARGWAKRLQSLRAARLISAGLDPLTEKLAAAKEETKTALPKLTERLGTLIEDLGRDKLAAGNYLPPWVPVAIAGDDERTDSFKDHLQKLAAQARVLDEIIRGGVEEVASRWDAAKPEPFKAALDKLDALPGTATTETVESDVAQIVKKLPPPSAPESAEEGAAQPAPPRHRPSPRELQLRLDYLYGSVWFIWAAITVTAGIGILILPDPGFGTAMDLLTSFFWGLGVQTAGNGLQQLTPGSLQSTLKITAPPTKA